MVRIATTDDKDLVYSLAMKFAESSPYAEYVDETKIRRVIDHYQADMHSIIFLYDDIGMLAATITPFTFGVVNMGVETAWWVEPGYRGKLAGKELLDAFEQWAQACGCSLAVVSCLDKQVSKYLEKRGYTLKESGYLKVF